MTEKNQQTRLQIATVITIIVCVISLTLYLAEIRHAAERRDDQIMVNIEKIQSELETLNESMILRTNERWRLTDMIIWSNQLGRMNPEISIPSPGPMSPMGPPMDDMQ